MSVVQFPGARRVREEALRDALLTAGVQLMVNAKLLLMRGSSSWSDAALAAREAFEAAGRGDLFHDNTSAIPMLFPTTGEGSDVLPDGWFDLSGARWIR